MRAGGSALPPSLAPFRRAAGFAATQPRFLIAVVLVAAAPGTLGALLLAERDGRAVTLVSSLLALYLQLLVTARVLYAAGAMPADYHPADATEARFPSALLAALLFLLGVAMAAVLLVVPGLLLYAAWSLWMPALLAERLRAAAALRRSWGLARGRIGWLLLVALWLLLGWIALLAPVIAAELAGVDTRVTDVAGELLVSVAQMAGAVAYAHAYMLCRQASLRP